MAHAPNGTGWKVAMYLLGVLVAIGLAWTTAISGDVETVRDRQVTTEENVRTIHYEAQTQRALLKKIAEALDINTDGVADVRPLREAE